jgi:hypothetical protein
MIKLKLLIDNNIKINMLDDTMKTLLVQNKMFQFKLGEDLLKNDLN